MASPIAHFLRDLRIRAGLTQTQLAHTLGFEQGYVSAVEVGIKNPSADMVARLIQTLELDESDQAELAESLRMSRRRLSIPPDAPPEIFLLVNELAEKLTILHPSQVAGIRHWMRADEDMRHRTGFRPSRIKRRDKKEAQM